MSLTLGRSLGPGVWSQPTLLMEPVPDSRRRGQKKGPTLREQQDRDYRRIETASTSKVQVLRLELPPPDDRRQRDDEEDDDGVRTFSTRCVFDIPRATASSALAIADGDGDEDGEPRKSRSNKKGKHDFEFPSRLALVMEVTGSLCSNTWHAKIFSECVEFDVVWRCLFPVVGCPPVALVLVRCNVRR